ncbi:MAG TPA: BON domain-containing protein [Chloroflexota bacterium]|jgi:osmotically-inducible protein OsmY
MADRIDVGASDELRTEVRARLDDDRLVRALARYEVAVYEGRATLVGHVRSRQVARGMAEAARRVQGVSAVDERLVADDELEVRVASAIGRGALNRTSRLVVRAEFGHVRIGGVYPSPEARAEALRLGSGVPGVVGATAARATDLITS